MYLISILFLPTAHEEPRGRVRVTISRKIFVRISSQRRSFASTRNYENNGSSRHSRSSFFRHEAHEISQSTRSITRQRKTKWKFTRSTSRTYLRASCDQSPDWRCLALMAESSRTWLAYGESHHGASQSRSPPLGRCQRLVRRSCCAVWNSNNLQDGQRLISRFFLVVPRARCDFSRK